MKNFEKKIVVRMQNAKALKDITAMYNNINNGVKTVIDNYLIIKKDTLNRLKGLFGEDELLWLVSRSNATVFDPAHAINKQITLVGLNDYNKFENPTELYNNIIKKIDQLSAGQLFFLNEFCYLWYAGDQDINKYIKELL